ncbi:MAG: phage terminase large subunit [Nitrosomonadaceae bacterium]
MADVVIDYAEKLHPIFTKPKRIKIVVGGRGSTKSTGIGDYVAAQVSRGALVCCAREHLESISESVHRLLIEEIERLGLEGFKDTKTRIEHPSTGGRTFYRGLSRNPSSLKSTLSGIDILWIEEGEDLTFETLKSLTASVRLNAKDTQRKLAGEDVKLPEIIITMNRGRRTGALAQKYLARAERELQRCGYYEDDLLMVVELNYTDMPQPWFLGSGLEAERVDDERVMSNSMYMHKWHGHYLDEVANAIIKGEWFDAAIDAHKLPHLEKMFQPHGAKVATHDCADGGRDAKAYSLRHGSIIKRCLANTSGEIDEGCDWATGEASNDGADWFIWDADGMGAGLKRQVATAFAGTHVKYYAFRGSLSGKGQDSADAIYMPHEHLNSNDESKPKKFSETFLNNRAQYSIRLADLFYNVYRCVVLGDYVDPIDMISLDSDGIEEMERLRAECCSVPKKPNSRGLIQILSKAEMKLLGIESPNMYDTLMMNTFIPQIVENTGDIDFVSMF